VGSLRPPNRRLTIYTIPYMVATPSRRSISSYVEGAFDLTQPETDYIYIYAPGCSDPYIHLLHAQLLTKIYPPIPTHHSDPQPAHLHTSEPTHEILYIYCYWIF
jgi:hypothetical protein